MCIMALALGVSQEFPFILIHNRDEEWSRPTGLPATLPNGIYCCTDLVAGGTWMGMNVRTGAVAALTNVRSKDRMPDARRSRGEIVKEALSQTDEGSGAYSAMRSSCYKYSILRSDSLFPKEGRVPRVWWEACVPSSKVPGEWDRAEREVERGGVYARSNERTTDLDEGSWSKCKWLRDKVAEEIEGTGPECVGREGARSLAMKLGRLLSTSVPFKKEDLGPLDFSPHDEATELLFQRGPFVDATSMETDPDGTRWQAVVISCASTGEVYYFFRDTLGVSGTEVHAREWMELCVSAAATAK